MGEVYLPGSTAPFRPVNPWGRAMPRPTWSARPALYQLIVKWEGRGEIPFGPKMELQFVQAFYDTVNGAIRSGVEKQLSDPHVVKCV